VSSFGGVDVGDVAIYINDILNLGIAINQGDMAMKYQIRPGPDVLFEIWR
jgi:S-adenosylmethionine hydrolase